MLELLEWFYGEYWAGYLILGIIAAGVVLFITDRRPKNRKK